MAADASQHTLNVPIPRSWLGKELIVRAWAAPEEGAPTWNGVATDERKTDRAQPYASDETLHFSGSGWDRQRFCLLREFVVPASAVRPDSNELSFAGGAQGRGEVSVGTAPTLYGLCGQTRHSRKKVSLDGADWRFKLVGDAAEAEASRLSGFKGVRSKIEVPSNWEMKGFSKPTYGQWRDESPTIGMYRRPLTLEVTQGERAHLAFDGASNDATVWLNGTWIGEHESGFTAFEYDVTEALTRGGNDLALRVSKYCRSAFFENAGQAGYWYLGGLFRSVYAYRTPSTYVSGFRTDTAFSADYSKAAATFTVEITGAESSHGEGSIRVSLRGPDGREHEGASASVALPGASNGWKGVRLVQAKVEVPAVALWSAETPNLYRARIELIAGGRVVDAVEEEIGLREVKIGGQTFTVNGVPVKLRGMCRHDFSPTDGYATKPELWRRDLELMREAGVNAVRCSHYSPAEGFIRLCDSMGFYVIHEAAAMWVGENGDAWYPEYHVRTADTLRRDMNRACVLMWGLGNEHADTVNFRRAALWCRRNDSRPAVYAGSADSLDGDIVTPHYVGKKLPTYLDLEPKRPVICTEDCTQSRSWWPSGSEALTDSFKSYWDDVILPDDRINGMFIWEWDERAVVYKDSILLSNTAGYGLNSYESIVGPWRRADLPWFNLLKQVYTPIRVEIEPGEDGPRLVIRNQYDFTALGDVEVTWRVSEVDATVKPCREIGAGHGKVSLPPRSSVELSPALPRDPEDWVAVDVELTRGGESLLKRRLFVEPAGHGALPPAIQASFAFPGDPGVPEGEVRLCSDYGYAVFDKRSGMLRRVAANGKETSIEGLIPNLWITPPGASRGGFSDRKESLDWGNVHCDSVEFGEADGRPAVIARQTLDRAANPVELRAIYSLTKEGVLVRYELTYSGREASVPAEGVRLVVPGTFASWRWRGRGPWATYPNLLLGADPGLYEAPIVAKRRVGSAIPMSEEHLIGQWEEAGGTKSAVDRFRLVGPDASLEIVLERPAFVELERVGDRVEVRVDAKVAEVGDRLVPLTGIEGAMTIGWPE